MTTDLVEMANAELSAVHGVVGTAKRAAAKSQLECVKLESAATSTLTAVTSWSTQVSGAAIPKPADPTDVTKAIANVSLTTTFTGGDLEGWVRQAEAARAALAEARDTAKNLQGWAEPAAKAYSSAARQLRVLTEWLEWLYSGLGQVLGGFEHLGKATATAAADHVSDLSGWLQDQTGRSGEAHAAFEENHREVAAVTGSLPASYTLLALASKEVPKSLQMAAITMGRISAQLRGETAR